MRQNSKRASVFLGLIESNFLYRVGKNRRARIAWRATPMLVFEQCQQAKGGDPMSSGNSERSIRSGLDMTALEQPLAFA